MEQKEIRADYDDRHITVYQAYSPEIADAALPAGRFVPPFKPGQERVPAVRITRSGVDWAVRAAVPSSASDVGKPDVRVQWDPERNLRLGALPYRSLQLGPAGDLDGARASLPVERPYPSPVDAPVL